MAFLTKRPPDGQAIDDLRRILLRGLRTGLGTKGFIADTDLDDFAQDALLKILDGLDTFRGESRFTTWAQKIAIRVALTELRRRRWHDRSLDELIEGANRGRNSSVDFTPGFLANANATPEQQTIRRTMLATVLCTIAEKLTHKQREAMLAVRVQGLSLEEVAQQTDTHPNTLYKRLFDARERLKKELAAQGIPAEEILSTFYWQVSWS